jgi:hypothetical protein
MDRRDHACALAERGFKVFKLPVGKKDGPPTKYFDLATSDVEAVREMWTAPSGASWLFNIGVATDDWVVADIDVKDGKHGLDSAFELELDFDTFTVRTPTGGLHLYYRDPAKVAGKNALLGPESGLDIKSWHNYVVAPGSETERGVYEIIKDVPIKPVPPLLAARLRAPTERTSDVPVGELDTPAKLEQAVHWLQAEPAPEIEPDVYRACAKLRAIGVSAEASLDLIQEHFIKRSPLWADGCDDAWLLARIKHAHAYGIAAPGSEAAEYLFDGVDIPEAPARDFGFSGWTMHGDPAREPYNWLFYQLVPAQGTTMLYGESSSGKTFLVTELARCLATGKAFFGEAPDEPGATAFVFGQTEGALFEERLAALKAEGALEALVEKLKAYKDHVLEAFGVPLKLVVFDTFYSLALTDDPNDAAKVTMAIGVLAALGKRLGVSVLFTHHPNKKGDSYSGSQAFRGAPDCILEIETNGRSVRMLKLFKARGAPTKTIGSFSLLAVPLGVDARGREITSCEVSMGLATVAGPAASPAANKIVEFVGMVLSGQDDVEEHNGRRWAAEAEVKRLFIEGFDSKNPEALWDKALGEACRASMLTDRLGHYGTTVLSVNEGGL